MKQIKSKAGYTVFETTADDVTKLGGAGICDFCNCFAQKGYLIPVLISKIARLHSYICPKCYSDWDNSGKMYAENLDVEKKRIKYYESTIQG